MALFCVFLAYTHPNKMEKPNAPFALSMTSFTLSYFRPICLPPIGWRPSIPPPIYWFDVLPSWSNLPHHMNNSTVVAPIMSIFVFSVACVTQTSPPLHNTSCHPIPQHVSSLAIPLLIRVIGVSIFPVEKSPPPVMSLRIHFPLCNPFGSHGTFLPWFSPRYLLNLLPFHTCYRTFPYRTPTYSCHFKCGNSYLLACRGNPPPSRATRSCCRGNFHPYRVSSSSCHRNHLRFHCCDRSFLCWVS